jgi:tetratricopeptide (TPR) repeat protein
VARPKKAKQRHEPESIAHRLDEIQSLGDRITYWIAENPRIVLSVAGAIVVVAAGYGLAGAARESSREEASASLGAAQADYRRAMGASGDDVLVSEPANPETARRVREEFRARFASVRDEHAGTAAAALAGLDLGELEQALGKPDEALATWQRAAAELGPDHVVSALLELRIAGLHEEKGRWLQAGEAFERAANAHDFPLRYTARAEAARCYAEAGEVERALAAFERVKSEDPDAFLPEHLNARLLELKAAQRLN